MNNDNLQEKTMLYLLSGLKSWFITALGLLVIMASVLSALPLSLKTVAFASSFISFAAAFAAGAVATRQRGGGGVITGLMTAAVITALLLAVGFVSEGREMETSGMISVVAFSLSGGAAGAFLLGQRRQKRGSFSFKRHR